MKLFALASCVPLLAVITAARSCPGLPDRVSKFRVRIRLQILPRSMARTALDATATTDRMEPHSISRTPTIRPGWTMPRCGRSSPMANPARRCRPSQNLRVVFSRMRRSTRSVHGMRSAWQKSGALKGQDLPPYTATLKGDAARGQQVYETACARCHQMTAQSITSPTYLALVNDQTLRTLIIAGRPDIGHARLGGRYSRTPAYAIRK